MRSGAGARAAANHLHVAAAYCLSIDGTDGRTDTVPLHRRSPLAAISRLIVFRQNIYLVPDDCRADVNVNVNQKF